MKDVWPILGGIILSFITFLLGKKQRKVADQSTELDSVQKAVSIWRGLAQDMKEEMVKWKDMAMKLESEVAELRTEVDRLRRIVNHAKDVQQ